MVENRAMSERVFGVESFWERQPWISGRIEPSSGQKRRITQKFDAEKEKSKDHGKDGGESDHEMHIWTERERRKKMRNMFSSLHALLPHLPPKADKSTIVDEAVNYIKTLEHTLQKLQKKKLETHMPSNPQKAKSMFDSREMVLADQGSSTSRQQTALLNPLSRIPIGFQTWTSSNVVLNICGDLAHFSICSPNKFGLFNAISFVLEKHKLEVVSAHVSSDHYKRLFMIQAHVSGVSDMFLESFPVEEIYKQAAAEIMLWVSS